MGTGSTLGLVRHKLSTARSVTVPDRAGISADSGVPTFRGADGLWRHYRAEDLATRKRSRATRAWCGMVQLAPELIAAKRPESGTRSRGLDGAALQAILAHHAECGRITP